MRDQGDEDDANCHKTVWPYPSLTAQKSGRLSYGLGTVCCGSQVDIFTVYEPDRKRTNQTHASLPARIEPGTETTQVRVARNRDLTSIQTNSAQCPESPAVEEVGAELRPRYFGI